MEKLKVLSRVCLAVIAIAIVVFVGDWLACRDWLWLVLFVPFVVIIALVWVTGWIFERVDRYESYSDRFFR